MKIDAKYGILPIPELKYDICDIVKQINMTCPIAKGSHSISVSDTIPGEVPSVSTSLVYVRTRDCYYHGFFHRVTTLRRLRLLTKTGRKLPPVMLTPAYNN